MPKYTYTAKTEDGKNLKGTLEAADEDALYRALKAEGKYLIAGKSDTEESSGKTKLKIPVVADYCRQLGTLLQAGVSLVRALHIIANEEGIKPQVQQIYLNMLTLIRQGLPLSEAMEQQGKAFPPLLTNMMHSAESHGNIDQASLRMANHYEKEYRLAGKVRSAMVYPIILSILLVGIVIIILTYLVPQFQDIFDTMDHLPLPTVLLLGMSDIMKQYWLLILLGLSVCILVIRLLFRIPIVRLYKDKAKLSIPVIGKLLRKIYTARFARTLSSLYSSGLPIVTALQVGSKTIGNAYIESQFGDVIARVRSGEALSQSLMQVDGFQKKMASTILVGEETGSLDTMLDSIADHLDYEAERALEQLVTMLEPAMIILMAIIVGFVMIAVILPIYQSYAAIEQGY
ncbi:MAG: type II secretion system F family protein [Lachnospiraceae bacterium]